MPIIIMLLSFLLVPSFVLAEDIYVAINTAGFDDGSSCANAHSASWFNTAANWGAGARKISGGDTTHLCGTITRQMVVQASGSVGSPITILFESGAKISQSVCSGGGGCFNMSGKSYIIVDGGTNGIIESTANGTSPTYANQLPSIGVSAQPCSNCEIKNLTIQNMYVHLFDKNDKVVAYDTVNAIKFSGSNMKIHDNIIHDTGWALFQQFGLADSFVEIYNNEIYHSSHGWTIAGGVVNAVATDMKFHDNYIHDYDNWDTTPVNNFSPYHHDGIHAFGSDTSNTSNGDRYDIYNNRFLGKCGTTMTAHIFMEGNVGSSWTTTGYARIFNNVFICESVVNGIVQFDIGHIEIYNNTIVGGVPGSGVCLMVLQGINALIKNNAIEGCNVLFSIDAATTIANHATDINYNTYGLCTSSNCWNWTGVSPFTAGFATWETNCGCDGNSTKNASLLLDSTGRPTAGSPVIGTGTNLSSLSISDLNRDKMLIARPSIGAWTVGAYHLASDTVRPSSPTNLRIQ